MARDFGASVCVPFFGGQLQQHDTPMTRPTPTSEPIPARNMEIVRRIQQGEKRYLLAEEYGLTKPSITMIGRKAGIAAYSRPGRRG